MKVEKSQCERITISEVAGLDPITVFTEQYGPAAGRITIRCYDEVWSYFWGSIGDNTIKKFFSSCNHHYLAKKLSPTTSGSLTDYDKLRSMARKTVGKRLVKQEINKDEAIDMLEELGWRDLEENRKESYHLLSDIFNTSDWMVDVPQKANPQYKYLCRIIDTVKEAFGGTQ